MLTASDLGSLCTPGALRSNRCPTPPCPHGDGPHSHLSSLGTFVTRAEATDADDPETDNAALRFSILEQGTPEFFSIDEHTGEIRTVQVGLDREVRQPRGHGASRSPHLIPSSLRAPHRAAPSHLSAYIVIITLTLILLCLCTNPLGQSLMPKDISESRLCSCTRVFLSQPLMQLPQPAICLLLPLTSDFSGITTDLLTSCSLTG